MQDRQRTEITAGQAIFCFAGLMIGGFIKGGEGAWYGLACSVIAVWAVYHSPFAEKIRRGLGEVVSLGFILVVGFITLTGVLTPGSCSGGGGYGEYRAP